LKRYALRDDSREEAGVLALLECHEHPLAFYIEISPEADLWDLPFVLYEHAMREHLSVGRAWSLRWVRSRLVPRERQNLKEVLRVNSLEHYDELALLGLTSGRCSQDGCYLVDAGREPLPSWYLRRLDSRPSDVYALPHARLLAIDHRGNAILYDAGEELAGKHEFAAVLTDDERFSRVSLLPGGRGACWGDSRELSTDELYAHGKPLPLDVDDLAALARQCPVTRGRPHRSSVARGKTSPNSYGEAACPL